MTATEVTENQLLDRVKRVLPKLEAGWQQAETQRRVSKETVAALRDSGLIRLWTPREYGGDEVDLPHFMSVAERIAQADSAAGWIFATGGAGPLLTAFIAPEGAAEIFANGPDQLLPGASAPTGRAIQVEGGYQVSGRWPLASGSHHGEWLGVVAPVLDGEAPRLDASGAPDLKAIFLRRDDCELLDTWHSLGMRGTGSVHLAVDDAFAPDNKVFSVFTGTPQVEGPLYRLGVLPMFAMSVASVLLGIARAGIDSFVEVARAKTPTFSQTGLATRPTIHAEIARAEAQLQSTRAFLYEVAEEMMACVKGGQSVSEDLEARRRLACANTGHSCTAVVDRVFALAGSTPIYSGHRLERCLRDVHTAGAHMFVSPVWWEKTGQYYFGLGLGMP